MPPKGGFREEQLADGCINAISAFSEEGIIAFSKECVEPVTVVAYTILLTMKAHT